MYYFILNIIEENTNSKLNIKLYSFLLNLIIFIFNFYLLFEKKCIKNEEKYEIKFKFKNDDNFLNLVSKTYEQISNYLNMKYNIINDISKNRKIYKKKISLYSVDLFDPKGHKLWIHQKLKDKFRIKFDKNNPDYLIYNIFGDEHLKNKYKDSIKIAIFTENKIPDLNEVDYAIGQAHINYLDRYFKFPIFLWFLNLLKNLKI